MTKRVKLGAALALGLGVALGLLVWLQHRAAAREAERRDQLAYAAEWELEHGQPQQALDKLRALAQVEPQRPGLRGAVGRALVSTGAAAEGAAALVEATAKEPTDAAAHEYLGVARAQLGALADAKAAFTRALELEPHRTSSWRRLAQVCLTSGDVRAATEAWRQALASAPADELAAIRAEARTLLGQAGRADEASAFAEAAAP